MKHLYKRHCITAGLIWACCFAALMLVYMLVLSPQHKRQIRVKQDLVETRLLYESVHQATQENTRKRLLGELEGLRSRMEDFAVDYKDLANLTFDISRMAAEEKLVSFSMKTRSDFSPSASEDKQLRENQIDLSFTAGFNQFARFMSALERHQPAIFVDKFSISRSGRNDGQHQVSINLAVFVRKSAAG